MAVNIPAHAFVISNAIALEKPKCFLNFMEVAGSNENRKFGPSHLEMLQQIKRSTSAGRYFDLARQSAVAFLARSMENSDSSAILLEVMPVIFSKGNRSLVWQPRTTSSVVTDLDGR